MRPLSLWARWLVQAQVLSLPIVGIAYAATDEQQVLSASAIIGCLSMVIAALLGLWSRSQDKSIDRAQKTADDALAAFEQLERTLLTHYRPQLEFARTIEAMLTPLRDDIARMRQDVKHVERMIYTGSRLVDPNLPEHMR